MRGTIVWRGLPDPIDTCEGLESTADAELLASRSLILGLDELFVALGRGATAGEVLEELELGRKDGRYEALQAAVEELFPRLKRGGAAVTPAQISSGSAFGSAANAASSIESWWDMVQERRVSCANCSWQSSEPC